MVSLSIALIVGVGALVLLAIVIVFSRRNLSAGFVATNEPKVDAPIRHALAQPPVQPRGVPPQGTPSPPTDSAQAEPPESDIAPPRSTGHAGPSPDFSNLATAECPAPLQPEISTLGGAERDSAARDPSSKKPTSFENTPAEIEAPERSIVPSGGGAADASAHGNELRQPKMAAQNVDISAAPLPPNSVQEIQSTLPGRTVAATPAPPDVPAEQDLEPLNEELRPELGQTELEPKAALPAHDNATPNLRRRPIRAVYKDRRGQKRRAQPEESNKAVGSNEPTPLTRSPAEARLRLVLHPIHQTARLSLVLARPEGFPSHAAIDFGGGIEFDAFNEARYDDIDLDWTSDTLTGELRFSSPDGLHWVRSARRVHIFATDPAEPGVMSVSSAKVSADHTVVCTEADAESVLAIAAAAGSPDLRRHDGWQGIPAGWCVLSGYIPKRAAGDLAKGDFRPLDPGFDIKIQLSSDLVLRPHVFAEGHSLRIEIPNLPEGVSVTIDGNAASANSSGAWEADGCAATGRHLIDLVPGPSLSYEIVADPGHAGNWLQWDAHEGRFEGSAPWARTWVCGASVCGSNGETVIAHETRPTLVALGSDDYATTLVPRPDAGVSVGLLPRPPAFLLVSSGPRRHQGQILWLGLEKTNAATSRGSGSVAFWAAIVRSAVARRLPLLADNSVVAKSTWKRAARRARALKRRIA